MVDDLKAAWSDAELDFLECGLFTRRTPPVRLLALLGGRGGVVVVDLSRRRRHVQLNGVGLHAILPQRRHRVQELTHRGRFARSAQL